MNEFVLPTQKIKASYQSPKNLIIISKPKVGKTELCSHLENFLLLDLEKGADYVDAIKVNASSVEEIQKIGNAVNKAGRPYRGVVVDTVSALEQMCIPYAEVLYSRTSMGKNWFKKKPDGSLDPTAGKVVYSNILNLPNGAGYQYLREAMIKMIEFIKTWAPYTIFLGHVKDTQLEKAGAEVSSLDLDLAGKIKRMLSSQSDAIGYLYRNGNQNILSFKTKDEIACGARPEHLRNREIVISEMTENGLVSHWDQVYVNEFN